ncbi:MAG: ATP-binding response regulator, partial [Rhodoferax sp.]
DTGIGIAADKMNHLFERFSQVDSSTTREYGGSGLGLAIVRHLAVAMGGAVGIESTPGQGSRFWFRIRAAHTAVREEARRSGPTRLAGHLPAAPLAGRVLVVEDNKINRMLLRSMLEKMGLSVELAEDGAQGLAALIGGSQVDLVFMDVQMPVMSGYEATQSIRRWEADSGRPRLPIIALTADAFPEDRQRCLAAGMDDFLTKPVVMAEVETALARWLAA